VNHNISEKLVPYERLPHLRAKMDLFLHIFRTIR